MAVYFEDDKIKAVERKVKVGEIVLRCATLVLGVAATALVVSNTEVGEIMSVQVKADFRDVKAMVFLVVANGLAAAYSLVQLVRCVASLLQGSVLYSRVVAWAIFISDQVIAYATLSAIAATMQAAMVTEYGQPEFQWRKTCNFFKHFCFQSGEGAVMAGLVSLGSVCLSGISAFNLFRLYDSNLT